MRPNQDGRAAADQAPRPLPASLYRFVWRESGRRQVLLALLTVVVFPLSLAPLELQRRIVNNAIKDPNVELLITLCVIYLGAAIAHALVKFARNMAVGVISEQVTRNLRLRIIHWVDPLAPNDDQLSDDANRPSGHEGAAVSLTAGEAEKVGGFAGDALSQPLLQGGVMVSVLGYMIWVDWRMALAALGVYIPAALLAPLVQRRINGHVARKTDLMRTLGDVMTGGDGGAKTDPARQAEDAPPRSRQANRPELLTLDVLKARLWIFLYKFGFKALNNLMSEFGRLVVLFVGGWFVIQGETEVGVIVAFLSGLEKVSDPARELLNFYRQLSQARVQYGQLRRGVGDGPPAERAGAQSG
ncbi:MAG: ABC transporter ATP-binding protein [Alphaproteobacteria bacterium]|nr:ABC transporter ATP-binding protein [Alphaproteobacteria bacterium]